MTLVSLGPGFLKEGKDRAVGERKKKNITKYEGPYMRSSIVPDTKYYSACLAYDVGN